MPAIKGLWAFFGFFIVALLFALACKEAFVTSFFFAVLMGVLAFIAQANSSN